MCTIPRRSLPNMTQYSARVLVATTALVTSTISLVLWLAWHAHKRKATKQPVVINKVLFFPDPAAAQFISSNTASDPSLPTVSKIGRIQTQNVDQGSLWELFKALQQAKCSIDVCMLTIASRELSDALIVAHQAGVIVRVVTNDEQMMFSGTQVNRLRRAGIQVRIDETAFLMHHKFVVVDGELLMSGSLNWTTQGLCGNQENVIITSEPNLVWPFLNQFEVLWKKYNPQ